MHIPFLLYSLVSLVVNVSYTGTVSTSYGHWLMESDNIHCSLGLCNPLWYKKKKKN